MSKQVLVNLNLNGNQIENVALHNVATLPASGVDGQVVFLTSDKNIYRWNGTAWVNVTPVVSVNDKTGVVTLAKGDVGLGNVDNTSDADKKTAFTGAISSGNTGFAVGGDVFTELGKKLDLTGGTMSGNIAMGGSKVTGLGAPSSDADAATKAYVDAVDSKIPQAGTATPLEDGTAAVGTSTKWAHEDHVHPTDTSRQEKITAEGILMGDGEGGVTTANPGVGEDYYVAPEGGIPKTDLASTVQASLTAADAALPKAGGTMTGAIAMGTNKITGLGTPTDTADAATKGYVDSSLPVASDAAPLMDGTAAAGSATTWSRADHVHPVDTSRQALITASGILKGNGSGGVTAATPITDYGTYSKPGTGIPKADLAQAVQDSLDKADNAVLKDGSVAMTGALAMGTHKITGVVDPTELQDAATKNYVDTKVSGLGTVLNFKGTVTSSSNLPSSNNKKGDVWLIGGDGATASEIGDEYVWVLEDGSAPTGETGWEKLGSNVDMSKYALLASPAFTGTPTAPTAATGTNTTQIATTAFVKDAIDNISGVIETSTGTIAANQTSVDVTYDGTLVNAYATMDGAEVVLTKTIGATKVTFSIAKAVTSAITCVVVSTKA